MVKISAVATLLFVAVSYPQPTEPAIPDEERSLESVHGIRFGMDQNEVVNSVKSNYQLPLAREFSRDQYTILEFDKLKGEDQRMDRMRVFVHPESGVFWIEEELYLRWDLQKPESDNAERYLRRLGHVLKRLRSKYGTEDLRENEDLRRRFTKEDFVMASWSFKNDRWIHVIYEPQDWTIWPELNKIVVVYRDATRYPD